MSPYLLLLLAVACVSFGSIFVRFAQAPALAVAFYRIGFASLLVAPFALRSARRAWPGLDARRRLLIAGAGLALALHFATWISSLSYTSIAASVLLVNLAPLFTLALSWALLGERVGTLVLGALALALAGAVLIAADDWAGQAARPLLGDALALAGAATLSIYHVVGRGLRAALPLAPYMLLVWSCAAVALALIALAAGVPFAPYPTRTLALFLALAVVPTLAGHGLVNRSLRQLSAPVVGLFLLGEPVGATALGYLCFGEAPGSLTLAGGLLVLVALALVAARPGR
jgi:drug/metabolite transporter (DMT)-like permease